MKNPKNISMYNPDKPTRYLKPKCCLVKSFIKNGIQQPDLGKFLSFLKNLGIDSIALAKKPFTCCSLVKTQATTIF